MVHIFPKKSVMVDRFNVCRVLHSSPQKSVNVNLFHIHEVSQRPLCVKYSSGDDVRDHKLGQIIKPQSLSGLICRVAYTVNLHIQITLKSWASVHEQQSFTKIQMVCVSICIKNCLPGITF